MIYNNILETIGHTPLVRINRLNPNPNVQLYAKLEGVNPSGSIKDRIAFKMIEHAEQMGVLTKGKTIIEATSGNTGIGLAMVGTVKGYDVEIIMAENVSVERQKMIKSLGASIILTDASLGTDGAIYKADELVQGNPEKYFMPNQYANEDNIMAHFSNTANEIWEDTKGQVTHFVSSVGTGGTLMGTGRGLKNKKPDIRLIEAHPECQHKIQGLKNMLESLVPKIYDPKQIDRSIMVESEAAFEMSREIALKEGMFVGMSSGAAMVAALECIKDMEEGFVVVLFPDRGEKYLSTELFGKP
jgi:S-sulfo-L-cysteine synthase (O-acetyl-L-serine-dependent)